MERYKFVTERRRFIATPVALLCLIYSAFAATYANAAQLRINPADGPGNSVILNGDFTFSVYQSNGNIDIAVSGVKLVFDCDTATDPQSCVVAVDSTASSQNVPGSSATTTTSPDTSTETTTSPDTSTEQCAGFGANQQCSGDKETPTTDSPPGSNPANEDPPEAEECTSIACLIAASSSEETSSEETPVEASDFATSDRVRSFDYDFGSAGSYATGNTYPVELSESRVRVAPLTMRKGVHRGSIGFVPTSKEPLNADLRLWVSKERDGEPVSDQCAYAGSFDGALDISVGEAGRCELEPSSTYYLNAAACLTTPDDYNCTKGAKNATRIGSIYLSAKYYD